MKYLFHTLLSFILLMLSENLVSQEASIMDKDREIFNSYVEYISPYTSEPAELILEHTALFFQGVPYVAHTLDKNSDEQLVVNLREMDCFTFVENVLALSLTAHSNNITMDSFKEKLVEIRYRNSEIKDYISRLHYTSDWLYENQQNGLLDNISAQLSGIKETKHIDFMSTHRSAYKQLANDDVMLSKIVQMEDTINNRGGFFYLPKKVIAEREKDIPHMSVIGFTTSIDGLDTTHVGFAFRKENGELTFIHASSTKVKVVIDSKLLSDYCISQKNCKGIIVAKVNL